jgi:uncharacterized membrane protein YfcA
LLGLGGGIIIVRALIYLFKTLEMDEQQLVHMAIIVTSFSSSAAHQSYGNVNWVIDRLFFLD